ncbi:DUF3298 and DUF4163 domain-containing protein [Confluentibacter flavum]|uniref:DUF3298/DUF4163 domain-containing protein n=1 Tax=Confluentibacter flavum TaxID=1909700 RepID=A0A2N3HLP5_9FLAO|nr:DUF3298 and DUF4163 domain-containing protein [Confluentibacter flavum]PKQ45876.1 DUF3298/DUF4163 domain-containing protein [Confluentibacter flavum]
MYNTKFILTLLCFLFLFSCNEEPKLVFKESSFTTEKNTLVEVIIPVATGDISIIDNINSIIKTHVIEMLRLDPSEPITIKTIEEGIDTFNDEYNRFKADFPESSQPWEAQIDGEIMCQSTELISISLTSYVNTGGAHGNLTISFLNFDAKTGMPIKSSDLFKNMEDFNALANRYFENTIEDKDILFDPQSFKLPDNIGLNDEGAVLLYNSYEIAPYSEGIIEFTIPFEKINSLLNFDSTQ